MRRVRPSIRATGQRLQGLRRGIALPSSVVLSTITGANAADGPSHLVSPRQKPGPCMDLADMRADPKITLSEPVVIDHDGLEKIERDNRCRVSC